MYCIVDNRPPGRKECMTNGSFWRTVGSRAGAPYSAADPDARSKAAMHAEESAATTAGTGAKNSAK